MSLFVLTWGGHLLAGHREHNESQCEHGQPEAGLGEYMGIPRALPRTVTSKSNGSHISPGVICPNGAIMAAYLPCPAGTPNSPTAKMAAVRRRLSTP